MRAWEIQEFGLDGLHLRADRPAEALSPWDVRVRIRAVSLNFRDWLMVKGQYNPRQRLPLVPCSDGAGEVVEVGAAVTRWKPGDRVCAIFAQGWQSGRVAKEKVSTTLGGPLDGTAREEAVFRESGLVRIPAHLDYAQAACLPCAAVTAWNAIVEQGQVHAGQVVLVQGTGGVSLFAMQFALLHGARVIVTSSSDEKLAAAKALGAHDTVNYRNVPDWEKQARELTGGAGVDHIIEVGGAGTLGKSLRAIRMGGAISIIGQLTGNATEVNLIPILMQNVRLQGVIVGSREVFETMNAAIEHNGLKPVVDPKRFQFEEAREAFAHLAAGSHFGKVVIDGAA